MVFFTQRSDRCLFVQLLVSIILWMCHILNAFISIKQPTRHNAHSSFELKILSGQNEKIKLQMKIVHYGSDLNSFCLSCPRIVIPLILVIVATILFLYNLFCECILCVVWFLFNFFSRSLWLFGPLFSFYLIGCCTFVYTLHIVCVCECVFVNVTMVLFRCDIRQILRKDNSLEENVLRIQKKMYYKEE